MGRPFDHRHETRMATFYTLTACLGFATDAALLKGGMALGLSAAWARAVSLFCAMQVTFWVNGLYVFKCLDRKQLHVQWLKYMGSNGVGNLCNYLAFTSLLSLHLHVISNRWFALVVGSLTAWIINYTATRLLVFRHHHTGALGPEKPARAAPCDALTGPAAPPA